MKVIMIIAPENFRDEEYFHPRQVLENSGIEVKVASTRETAISGIKRQEVKTDMTIEEIGKEFDGIIFVGGEGAKIYFDNQNIMALIRSYYENHKIVAAICIAPKILGLAGILKGKSVTSWAGVAEELKNMGAQHTGQQVEIDGKIITGNGPNAGYKFGEAIAESL